MANGQTAPRGKETRPFVVTWKESVVEVVSLVWKAKAGSVERDLLLFQNTCAVLVIAMLVAQLLDRP